MTTTSVPAGQLLRRRIVATAVALGLAAGGAIAVQHAVLTASAARAADSSPTSVAPGGATPPDVGEPNGSTLAPSEADGVIRDDAKPTVFDETLPAISKLDPALLSALREAATDAAGDGVEFRVNSGWRSAALQQKLLTDAIADYGSLEEASRWVASPETSAHVTGDAVDLGPLAALDWLAQHGADYGLCQTYANEAWHYELRPDAVDQGCPQMFEDAGDDPRMRS